MPSKHLEMHMIPTSGLHPNSMVVRSQKMIEPREVWASNLYCHVATGLEAQVLELLQSAALTDLLSSLRRTKDAKLQISIELRTLA